MVELHRQNYNENKKIYNRIEIILKEKLGDNTPINHVGSTAIKNMWGKNIIDVLVGASSENEMEEFSKIIKDLGFFSGNNSSGMIYRFFANTKEETKSGDIHIHLAYINSDRYQDFLLLKNYLVQNSKETKDYSDFKRNLINNGNILREDYKNIKSKYVTDLIERAKDYYNHN